MHTEKLPSNEIMKVIVKFIDSIIYKITELLNDINTEYKNDNPHNTRPKYSNRIK